MELRILFIIPLLYNAQLIASQSEPHLANSLDVARNISADFPSGAYTSNPKYTPTYQSTPNQKPDSSTFKYWTTQPTSPTQSSTNYIPPCWTQTTKPTTTHTTPRYSPPTTASTTKYIPPCWTQTTTPKPTYTTPRYTPPTTVSTTKYIPPCWTQTTTAKPTYTTPRYTPPTTVSTTKYIPPCWTQTTTAKPTYTTPRYTPPTTVSTTKYIPPCWTQTTTSKPTQTTPPTTVSTTNYIPPCWTQRTTVTPPARTTVYPGLENFICDKKYSFYSVPNECDTFIECKDNIARKHFCPEGLVYKPDTIWPKYPCVLQSEYKCLNGSITQPARPNGQCPHENGYYPVPNSDCSQYIVCEQGVATLMNCPKGLVFNVEISDCDWPIAVPSCHPDALKDFTCPSMNDAQDDTISKYRYYNSCTNYVACQNGFPRLLSCSAGLRFDQDQQQCVDESSVANCDA